MKYELLIHNGSKIYSPSVLSDIKLTSERKCSPSKLEFDVYNDKTLNVEEGNLVTFRVDEYDAFYGFIFTKKYDNDKITITAYDQLRYLKNKDTMSYTNRRLDELIMLIASEYNLRTGILFNSGYKIASRVEDNTTLMDMIQNAMDLTMQATGDMYVVYDQSGYINLSYIGNMLVPILLDETTGSSIEYTSSIDKQTYNKVKLVYDNEESGEREVYVAQHGENMNKWGTLQFFEKLQNNVNGKALADTILKLYNKKTRSLTISKAFGHKLVRGGSLVAVQLDLGDIKLQNLMLVEKCTHTYGKDEHTMDLTLAGGDFVV